MERERGRYIYIYMRRASNEDPFRGKGVGVLREEREGPKLWGKGKKGASK